MNLKALVGAAALTALVASGAAVAYAQDAPAPGTMAPIPNPPETPKASHHHHAKHMKAHGKHHKAGKSSKAKTAPAK